MMHKTPWHIFFKCFRNQATSEELAEINNWLEEDVVHLEMLEEIYNIYSVSRKLSSPLNPNTLKAWDKVNQKISSRPQTRRPLYITIKHIAVIAAIFVFGLMIFGLVNNYIRDNQFSGQFTEIVTRPGQKSSVNLPDGSSVWLNSGSRLKYASNFNDKEREVILTGEAYFEVRKDKSKRFRVKCGRLNVDVHGTSFDIKNYPNDKLQEVTVSEGIVSVGTGETNHIRRITRGEQAIVNKETGEISFTEKDPDFVSAWKNNELIFRDTPIEEVFKSLESWYGVEITVDHDMIGGHNYTFKIKTEIFKEVLEMMKIMTPFEYKINGKDIIIKYK